MKHLRRRRIINRRPNRQKTIHDLTELTGTEYYQTEDGFTFYTEDIASNHMITFADLLAKFYRINEDQNPLVMRLMEEPHSIIQGDKVWQVMMRGNFRIRVESNKERHGPHSCQLWFTSFSDHKHYWLASCQLVVFYYNEEQMRQAILDATKNKEFYMLPANADIAIMP